MKFGKRFVAAIGDLVASITGLVGVFAIAHALARFGEPLAAAWAVGSLGASMTLILACPDSPLAKPYPAMVGNTVSALIGVTAYQLIGQQQPLLATLLAVALAIAAMRLLGALHPPGGASAILAVVGGATVHKLGWLYPLFPIAAGTGWLLLIARVRMVWLPRYRPTGRVECRVRE